MAELSIISAGQGLTVQDLGRPGWKAQGLSTGGAADPLALLEAAALLAGGEGAFLTAEVASECHYDPSFRALFHHDGVLVQAAAHSSVPVLLACAATAEPFMADVLKLPPSLIDSDGPSYGVGYPDEVFYEVLHHAMVHSPAQTGALMSYIDQSARVLHTLAAARCSGIRQPVAINCTDVCIWLNTLLMMLHHCPQRMSCLAHDLVRIVCVYSGSTAAQPAAEATMQTLAIRCVAVLQRSFPTSICNSLVEEGDGPWLLRLVSTCNDEAWNMFLSSCLLPLIAASVAPSSSNLSALLSTLVYAALRLARADDNAFAPANICVGDEWHQWADYRALSGSNGDDCRQPGTALASALLEMDVFSAVMVHTRLSRLV
jgi:hypothetical protein